MSLMERVLGRSNRYSGVISMAGVLRATGTLRKCTTPADASRGRLGRVEAARRRRVVRHVLRTMLLDVTGSLFFGETDLVHALFQRL